MRHSSAASSYSSGFWPTLFLACVVLLSLGLTLTHSYRIYAVSEELDVWSGGKWTKLPFYFGKTEGRYFGNYFTPATFYPLRHQKVGLDRANNLFITEVNGIQGQRPFTTTQKWSTVNNTLVGNSFYIGRWAFDSSNNFYSVYRYNPAGPPRDPIVKIPSR
jgi:hypothetical protein